MTDRRIGSFNTASGKYCCNPRNPYGDSCIREDCVSIPQAVSTVATKIKKLKLTQNCLKVSIPQAVSTVATTVFWDKVVDFLSKVSIPQAVSTVATYKYEL